MRFSINGKLQRRRTSLMALLSPFSIHFHFHPPLPDGRADEAWELSDK
jgi:hypothetical protein